MLARLDAPDDKKLIHMTSKLAKIPKVPGQANEGEWAWLSIIKPGEESIEKRFKGNMYVHCPTMGIPRGS